MRTPSVPEGVLVLVRPNQIELCIGHVSRVLTPDEARSIGYHFYDAADESERQQREFTATKIREERDRNRRKTA